MVGKICKILIVFVFMLFSSRVLADAGYPAPTAPAPPPASTTPTDSGCEITPFSGGTTTSAQPGYTDTTRKIFSLGRGLGASYYHLIDLCDKSRDMPFETIQQEYNTTFQNLNIIDIVLDDLNINGNPRHTLNKVRMNFYDTLRKKDLSETKLSFVRDMFVVFYENLSRYISRNYSCRESWVMGLGFYASFQLESLNSYRDEKILLSGFEKIMSRRTVVVPKSVYEDLVAIYRLDKPYVTTAELISLKKNLISVIEFFTNYSHPEPLFNEIKDLVGVWQGILFNPDNEKYDIRLNVREDLTASMDINGIASDVAVSNIRVVNNYFTFMFKPFGTEKLYLRFDAKLSENMFTGEITDVIGEKGYWVLAKTDKDCGLSDAKLDQMVSYINKIEAKLNSSGGIAVSAGEEQTVDKVSEEKPETELQETTAEKPVNEILPAEEKIDEVSVENSEPAESSDDEKISKPTVQPVEKNVCEKEIPAEKKGVIKKLKSLFVRLFSFIKL